jgi:hypothetical protein
MLSTVFLATSGVVVRVWANALAKERYFARKNFFLQIFVFYF